MCIRDRQEGEIVELGQAERIFTAPQNAFTQKLLAASHVPPALGQVQARDLLEVRA